MISLRSLRRSRLVLPLFVGWALSPFLHATTVEDLRVADFAFSSGFELFYGGPQWFVSALPGSKRVQSRYVFDRAGDVVESTSRYNVYVGTFGDVFNVNLFSNVNLFVGPTGGKSSGVTAAALNSANNYIGAATGSLLSSGNWSLGHVPTVSEDAVFTATTGIRTLTAGSLTVGSFNVTASTGTFSIRNETSTATNSTLTLGGSSSTGNGVSGTSADLLFANTGSTFNIIGPNGNTGSGVLNVVLGQSGNFNAAGTIGISSAISDGGSAFGITKTGAGTLTFSGTSANTYSGLTTVNAGELDFNKSAGTNAIAGNLTIGDGSGTDTVKLLAADQIANTSDLTIASSGVLNLNNNNETIDALNSISSAASILLGSATLTVGANNETSFGYAGTSSGTGGLTKTGSGVLILSGANGYTGDTTIKAGEILLAASGSLSSSSTIRLGDTITSSPAATFAFGAAGGGETVANALIVQASGGTEGTRTILGLGTSGNTNTWTGNITLNTDVVVQSAAVGGSVTNGQGILLFQTGTIDVLDNAFKMDSNLNGNNADTYSIQGIVRINTLLGSSLATGGSVVKDGSGTLILQGTSNTYTGTDASNLNPNGTIIRGGVLGIFGDGSLGLAPSSPFGENNVFFQSSAFNTNTDSIAPTLRAEVDGIVLGGTRFINIASGVTGQIDSNGYTFTIDGSINGAGNLRKIGNGTLVLTSANFYSGTTTVNEGTLNAAFTFALGGTSSIVVNRGGTLLVTESAFDRINDSAPIQLGTATGTGTPTFARSGSGVVSEGVGATSTGGVPFGSSSVGLGALSLQSNATFDFGSGGVGTFVFTSFTANTNTLNILNWTSNASFSGLVSGTDGVDDRLIFAGLPTDVVFITFNGTPAAFIPLDIGFYEVVPVPEPGTWIGGALALAAIGFTQRRRRGLLPHRV